LSHSDSALEVVTTMHYTNRSTLYLLLFFTPMTNKIVLNMQLSTSTSAHMLEHAEDKITNIKQNRKISQM